MLIVHSATDNSITTSNVCLSLRYWLTNKINIKRPSTGLLMYTMATRFCDEIYLYGFWPFPKDGNGNPVKYHYYDGLRYRYFSNAGPHRMPLEFKTLKRLHSKGALKLTTSKCTYTWLRAAHERKDTQNSSEDWEIKLKCVSSFGEGVCLQLSCETSDWFTKVQCFTHWTNYCCFQLINETVLLSALILQSW